MSPKRLAFWISVKIAALVAIGYFIVPMLMPE